MSALSERKIPNIFVTLIAAILAVGIINNRHHRAHVSVSQSASLHSANANVAIGGQRTPAGVQELRTGIARAPSVICTGWAAVIIYPCMSQLYVIFFLFQPLSDSEKKPLRRSTG